jgi:hypothetical protein
MSGDTYNQKEEGTSAISGTMQITDPMSVCPKVIGPRIPPVIRVSIQRYVYGAVIVSMTRAFGQSRIGSGVFVISFLWQIQGKFFRCLSGNVESCT